MYPKIAELLTESDVEQKLIFPLLTTPMPDGLGYSTVDILTKANIKRLPIGKGNQKKIYYPDYIVVLAGLPVLVIEAKSVGEPIDIALDEARLYANEINALYPHRTNPCSRVIACNGNQIVTAPSDTVIPDVDLTLEEISPANVRFSLFVDACCRGAFQKIVDTVRSRLRPAQHTRPVSRVGGSAFQNEELPQNTFGATIAGDYGHIFNPKNRDDRGRIVREAYIGSLRRQRYVEPIDRLVRNAVAPIASKIRPLENSATPNEITSALTDRKNLENQIILLIGSVGAGKSTFVDYLSLVALPPEVRAKTIWLRLNLNEAPLSLEHAYNWVAKSVATELRQSAPDLDFDTLEMLEKIFTHELNALKKGPLALLNPDSNEYLTRIADRLMALQADPLAMAKGIANLLCNGPNLLLVVVLDNCDKRNRDEQLTMFQVAQWAQTEFRCLIVLPLRDVTFDLHRHDPPLDTALKQFVFRIEPPSFSDVLQARVRLALKEISSTSSSASALSYRLPNGMTVAYPAEDQALYLASILRSLYAHDRFVRQVMTGLAGRDVRRALEIFLEFCMSGHIGEDEIFQIRISQGQHVLPLPVVARVLLRMHRRFYDGNRSYLKNIVQCDPEDALPDHFVRLAILHWFSQKRKVKGPAGVEGFHRASDMLSELAILGHDTARTRKELSYLALEGCLVPEHLKASRIEDIDLVKISAAGVVHLQLLANPEYLAACAEDTWISDSDLSKRISERISCSIDAHFSHMTTTRNAIDFVEYLKNRSAAALRAPDVFVQEGVATQLRTLREAEAGVAAAELSLPDRIYIGGLHPATTEDDIRTALLEHGVSIKSISLPMKSHENRGFAFLEPSTKAEVLIALDLDGKLHIHGRRLRLNEAHSPDMRQSADTSRTTPLVTLSCRIYVSNLPFSCSVIDLREFLAKSDLTATDIFLLTDKDSGTSRGSGFVEFSSIDEAAQAISALNGLEFHGRVLHAKPATPRS